MRLLVTGASGLLGSELLRLAEHDVVPAYHSQAVPDGVRIDVRQRDEVAAVLRSVRPDAVIHTAYRQDSWSATADGAVNVALAATGCRLVFVSSDAVFGGRDEPYAEHEPPCPITPYGAAKAAAETAIRALRPDALIARTSIIVASDGSSGEERRVHHVAAGGEAVFFEQSIRRPVHVTDLAKALLELLTTDTSGIAHLGGPTSLSRFELARLIAARDGIDAELKPVPGEPSTIQLDSTHTAATLKTRLRPPSEYLAVRK